jgi:hypothetical protein
MIPLTKEAREGLTKMVAVADCGKPGLRDPKMTAAMAWIESLPEGPIDPWPIRLDSNCAGCPLGDHGGGHFCQLSWVLDCEERPCDYETVPQWCRLRSGGVLVVGHGP